MQCELVLKGPGPTDARSLRVFNNSEDANRWVARHVKKQRTGRPPTAVHVTFADGKTMVFQSMSDFAATDSRLNVSRVSEALRRAKPRPLFGIPYPCATLKGYLLAKASDVAMFEGL